MKKKASLRRTYYGAFFLLTVLPLLVAACVGLGYFYRMQLSDARETIELQQKSVSDTLRQEVQQASLQLSHFLLSPEGDALSLVQQLPKAPASGMKFNRLWMIPSDITGSPATAWRRCICT